MLKFKLWPALYSIALAAFTVYVLLDALVIPRSYSRVQENASAQSSSSSTTSEAVVTDTTYDDGKISIQITQYREYETDIYVADVTLSDASLLKTALAEDTYGKNITQITSSIAENHGAVLAINGDYYGARNGYVIRNGVLYRATSSGDDQQDLAIFSDGSFKVISEGSVTAQELLDQGAQQVLSFGPGLLDGGTITVNSDTEVDRAKSSNPRTAIGMIDQLHYLFVVADGRTSQSTGLSLYELAEFMQSLGAQTAYNLDGGGSSTMTFNGTVINRPTSDGKNIKERAVSDIVYVG
jgi:exopolysaccharide biosynthesis protein